MSATKISSRRYLLPTSAVLILVVLATAPLYASTYPIILLTAILMHVTLTISWTIFSSATGYMSLASAAFFGIGIYASAVLGSKLPLYAILLIGGFGSFLLALLVGALTLRLRGIYFTVFTFGLVELIRHLLLWWEMNVTATRGRFVIIVDHEIVYSYMLALLAITLLTAYLIRRSRFGLALRSIGEDEDAAAHVGINVTAVKVFTFAISALFMGAAGSIMAMRWSYIDPYIAFNALFSFTPVLMAIFGGMDHLYGPILGAAVFAYIEEILITRFPYYYKLLFGIVLVAAVLYLPGGLVGLIHRIRARVRRRQNAST
jgi:branched-chain amino acid transport system permease protein